MRVHEDAHAALLQGRERRFETERRGRTGPVEPTLVRERGPLGEDCQYWKVQRGDQQCQAKLPSGNRSILHKFFRESPNRGF